jgi:membrane-associated phospholipid phosphatase
MSEDDHFRRTLRQSFLAIVACTAAVVVCYYFVDRPVAFFVHDHRIARFEEQRWLTEPPPLVQSWAPLVLVLLVIRRAGGRWRHWEHVLFIACVSLIVADQFRQSLGDLCGRYWPETWHDNNPSFIGTGAYGFHPFQVGDDVGSFPSGHSARILAFASVFWLAIPRSRLACFVLGLPMLVALVGMDYHFVSDVIAGSTLGGVVGVWAVRLSTLDSEGRTG